MSVNNDFVLGNVVELRALFTDPDDNSPINPDTMTFSVKEPDDTVKTYVSGVDSEATNPTTGEFRCIFTPTMLGTHYWEVVSEGFQIIDIGRANGEFSVIR